MSQIIPGAKGFVYASGSLYNILYGGDDWDYNIASRQVLFKEPGELFEFYVEIPTAPGVGNSWTFTIMNNGVATSAVVTISGTDTFGSDLSNRVTVSLRDLISIRATGSGSPPAVIPRWSIRFVPDTAGRNVLLSCSDTNRATGTIWRRIEGAASAISPETSARAVFPTPGTLKSFGVGLTVSPGSGCSRTFTLRKNLVSTSSQIVISNDATEGDDDADEISVIAGDAITIQETVSGSAQVNSAYYFGLVFEPTVANETVILGKNTSNPDVGQTKYMYIAGAGTGGLAWSYTEPPVRQNFGKCRLTKFQAFTNDVPSSGQVYLYVMYLNGASSQLTVSVSSGYNPNINDSTILEVSETDEVTLSLYISGGVERVSHWGCVALPLIIPGYIWVQNECLCWTGTNGPVNVIGTSGSIATVAAGYLWNNKTELYYTDCSSGIRMISGVVSGISGEAGHLWIQSNYLNYTDMSSIGRYIVSTSSL